MSSSLAEARTKSHVGDAFDNRGERGERFISDHFVSADALAHALQYELLELLNDPGVTELLPEAVQSSVRAAIVSNPLEGATRIVAVVSDRHQTRLQKAILTFLADRPGSTFCLSECKLDAQTSRVLMSSIF